ncbi:hypothetical protein FQN60_003515 [Etheostoma spectabile]|uniref:ZP domain-containing protein n=1 Tax=Etheostoma spectabile TaxID=54343 RepID=A0A5J5CZR4_9PERO|nr:hypothetical protein FQN60_003515 [Etheostoma spectabile]
MRLKQKGYCFGVLLIFTVTTIHLPSAGSSQPHSRLVHSNDKSSVLTTRGLPHSSNRESRKRPHSDSKPGEGSRNPPYFHVSEHRYGTQTETSGGPKHTLKPKMASTLTDKSFRNSEKAKRSDGEWTFFSPNPPNEECSKGEIEHVIPGKFYIPGQLETNLNMGYQADSAVSGPAHKCQERTRGQRLRGSQESWQRLQPLVECGDAAMTLTVRRRRAAQLQLDIVNESSVPLSRLPPQCGYADDSFVLPLLWRGTPVKMLCPASQIQPVAAGPSSLCCSPHSLTVRVQGPHAAEDLRVNVRGEWTPVAVLAERCDYTLDRQDAEIVITAPFITCGITIKDGKYTLSLQIGEKTFTLACPVSPHEELPLTPQPLVDSPTPLTRGPTEQVPDPVEAFPWAPPFYLAPLYYPHPTYHHKYPRSDRRHPNNPPTPSSPTPPPTSVPQPLPLVDHYPHQIPVRESYKHFGVPGFLLLTGDPEDSSRAYQDLQQKQDTSIVAVSESAARSPASDTGFAIEVEPPFQPPSHAFNPYYHYYHHPKIPLPGPPQNRDPEVPRERSLNNPHNPEYPALPPDVMQSEALRRVDSHQFLQPWTEAAAHPNPLPASPPKTSAPYTPHPPQPYPYPYFYHFPHFILGEAKRLAPSTADVSAKTRLSDQNTKPSRFGYPLPASSHFPDKHYLNPYIHQPDNSINFLKNGPEGLKHQLLSENYINTGDVKAELDDKKRHSASVRPAVQPLPPPAHPPQPDAVAVPASDPPIIPTPSPNHNLPPHSYYYHHHHPYNHYYQMFYGPVNHPSPTLSKEALDPLHQASSSLPQRPSYYKLQTATPPTKSMPDPLHPGPLHPYYYYYHHYHQPQVSVHSQELHPACRVNSEGDASKAESPLPSDPYRDWADWLGRAADAGYPSIPQPVHSPYPSLDSYYITQRRLFDVFGRPGGEEAEARLDREMKDHLRANPSTPSASPCALGPVSDVDCSASLGCCSYSVKDCTMGQHFIFPVPDSVLEPTVALPAHPSEHKRVSCRLQKLTSDPDLYAVPLDGCGVNTHVFGQTVVHLLEVHGIYSHRDPSSVHGNSPVRLMVECSSSPGCPGEVRLHVMDHPPPPVQSTPATVQLRIATDESFTRFHPEAHLPLSLMRGRAVYVEVSLLAPQEPGLVLLVHSCLAYAPAPHNSWLLVYDGCPGRGDSQLLPSPHSDPHRTRRIVVYGVPPLPSEGPSYMAEGGCAHLKDPEIYFLCLTEVCLAADGDCTVGCIYSKFNIVETYRRN